jgi:hypothetical protein
MACDRFVYWNEKKPTQEQVQLVLEDYVRDLATEVKWDQGRFYVVLPGMGSNPLARVSDWPLMADMAKEQRETERWIEVWLGDDCLDVITRHADEITNNIASGFAKLCARYWKGRLEEG